MNNTTSITLSQSGEPIKLPNGLLDTTSISVNYTIAGTPASMTISISGVKKAGGEVAVLDSYNGTSNTSRTINLSDTFDYFQIVGTWTDQNASVAVALSATGPGPTFSSSSLSAVQTFAG